jgi:hypothetical protein
MFLKMYELVNKWATTLFTNTLYAAMTYYFNTVLYDHTENKPLKLKLEM